MVPQVKEETWLEYQEIQGTIFCNIVLPDDTVSWTPELILSSGTMGDSEVDVDFSIYSRFEESK